MGLRMWIFCVGAILGVVGALLLVVPISVTPPYGARDVACGTAVSPTGPGGLAAVLAGELTPAEQRLLRAVETGPISGVSQCGEAVATMQTACWIVAGLAVCALVGGAFMPRSGAGHRETAPAHPGDESGSAGASRAAQGGHGGKDSPVQGAGPASAVDPAEVG